MIQNRAAWERGRTVGRYIINGGKPLRGLMDVHGAKNSALPIMAACLLSQGVCTIGNVPALSDVEIMAEILECSGAKASYAEGVLRIDSSCLADGEIPEPLMRKMRSSFIVVGPLLARLGRVKVTYPGGCAIGTRAIDLHLKGLARLGVTVRESYGSIEFVAKQLQGANIYLDYPSVGATENIMMAAVTAKGTTIISNAAREPEIVDLQNFLNRLGAKIAGAGTDQIRVDGVEELGSATYDIIPDRIVAGTLLVAAAATGGTITLQKVIPEHLTLATGKLVEMGAWIETGENWITVTGPERLGPVDKITTAPHPGFPTDMQPFFMAALAVADGVSIVTEMVFDGRFKHVDELRRMGANISIDNRAAIIRGVPELTGALVEATDLRAGAALTVAGLIAQGTTIIDCIEHVDRGYVSLEEQLRSLGADIRRTEGGVCS
ncbi:MAG: UDP-N-acetylglucosamine 1-carboxyvinyltransferase [Firmicutes bacterium]|nr:UDP-N-acetylglucosamine 1-carboxyvinyltransferase [Bacillota bacterium]